MGKHALERLADFTLAQLNAAFPKEKKRAAADCGINIHDTPTDRWSGDFLPPAEYIAPDREQTRH